jgi:hypothetical protein
MPRIHVINLKGTQAEMGTQYGQIMRASGPQEDTHRCLTSLSMRLLMDANHRSLGGRLSQAAIWVAMQVAMRRLHRHRPQEYVERSRAFFRCVGMPMSTAKHLVLMDAFQNLVGRAGGANIGPFAQRAGRAMTAACSSTVVWDDTSNDGLLRHARNFDYPCVGVWDVQPAVVFCDPADGLRYGYVSTLGVDIPGVTGFNEAGICVAAHTRFHRRVRFDGRCIVDLCHDIVRRASTIEEAVARCREHPIASTWGICISSAAEHQAVVVETTGDGVFVVRPSSNENAIVCTNRNRHPESMPGQVAPMPAWREHSDSRTSRMKSVVAEGKGRGGLGAVDLMQLLGDRVDPQTGVERAGGGVISQAMTVQSVVFSPEESTAYVSAGDAPTGQGPYVSIPWDWSASVGHQELSPDPVWSGHVANATPAEEAYAFWCEASRVDVEEHRSAKTLALVEQAVALHPDEPTYRFMAGVLQLRHGQWAVALAHFDVGTQAVQSTFRTVQCWVWGARAADAAGQPDRARQWRLDALERADAHTAPLHALAREEMDRPCARSKLRRLIYNVDLVDATL